jgi:sugar (pentulose or hexulose) kinase
MSRYLLGLDYGTGGAKAALVDPEGAVVGYAFEEYPLLHPQPGWSEHDPRRYWEVAGRLIRLCLEQARALPAEVRGLAVSSALPSMVMVDERGCPVAAAYNLLDRRAQAEVEWLKREIGEERIFAISKNRLDDHPSIVNLVWEKRHRPEVFSQIHKTLTIDGYINLKLTGRATAHYSAAAFWGVAYNLLERSFDAELLEVLGIAPELLPELYPCEAIIGEVTPGAARDLGLAAGIPVVAGQVDCNAGWVGAGAIAPGDIQMNLGTCGNFGIIHQDTRFLETMIGFAYTTDSTRTYVTVPTTTTGGQLLRYMRDEFFRAEVRTETSTGVNTFDLINQEAASAPPGAEGLIVLPFLMGERTPIWDSYARGVVFGLSLHHTRGHVLRAMMESVAYALYDSFRIIQQTGRKMNFPIVLNEGGAKSPLWRRIITDVFQVPTVLVERRTGAPYGDAILAGVATGIFPGFEVARQWSRYIEPMEPDPRHRDLYQNHFRLYKQLYEHVRSDFRELAALTRSKGER